MKKKVLALEMCIRDRCRLCCLPDGRLIYHSQQSVLGGARVYGRRIVSAVYRGI